MRSAAWLAARWAAWLAARWADEIEKAEKFGEMLIFYDFRGDVWHFSRFDRFVEVAFFRSGIPDRKSGKLALFPFRRVCSFDLRSAAWLAARLARQKHRYLQCFLL